MSSIERLQKLLSADPLMLLKEFDRIQSQRDALLEACKVARQRLLGYTESDPKYLNTPLEILDDAIAKATANANP